MIVCLGETHQLQTISPAAAAAGGAAAAAGASAEVS